MKDGYTKLLEEFIDEMEVQGKISQADLNRFLLKKKCEKEVKEIVEGMIPL